MERKSNVSHSGQLLGVAGGCPTPCPTPCAGREKSRGRVAAGPENTAPAEDRKANIVGAREAEDPLERRGNPEGRQIAVKYAPPPAKTRQNGQGGEMAACRHPRADLINRRKPPPGKAGGRKRASGRSACGFRHNPRNPGNIIIEEEHTKAPNPG